MMMKTITTTVKIAAIYLPNTCHEPGTTQVLCTLLHSTAETNYQPHFIDEETSIQGRQASLSEKITQTLLCFFFQHINAIDLDATDKGMFPL